MTRTISVLAACLITSAAIGHAQQRPTPPPPKDVTLTGCLTQGSMPSIFILDHARPSNGSTGEVAVRYLVVSESKDVDFLSYLNHQVELRGTVTGPIPPLEKQRTEETLPTLRVVELTMLSASCAAEDLPLADGPGATVAQQIQEKPKVLEVTARGCLTTSESGTYLLSHAVPEAGITGSNLTFKLVPDNAGIELKPHLSHIVRVTGPLDGMVQPTPVPEAELPTIHVRLLAMVTNECLRP